MTAPTTPLVLDSATVAGVRAKLSGVLEIVDGYSNFPADPLIECHRRPKPRPARQYLETTLSCIEYSRIRDDRPPR
jgi:hypothetical protein